MKWVNFFLLSAFSLKLIQHKHKHLWKYNLQDIRDGVKDKERSDKIMYKNSGQYFKVTERKELLCLTGQDVV